MTEWRIHIADDWATGPGVTRRLVIHRYVGDQHETILEDSLTVERGRVNRILDRLVPGGAE